MSGEAVWNSPSRGQLAANVYAAEAEQMGAADILERLTGHANYDVWNQARTMLEVYFDDPEVEGEEIEIF